MSRSPLIEAIHEARYDLETCAPHEKPELRRKLDELIAQALARCASKPSRHEVLNLLYDDYKEFRKMKKRQEWPKL
ncbi:MAG: hypothetical protein O2960_20375 [Verrucomicrobia bacterium]|nr:hypothetical protein [Verrucomicrobiota bacterium]